MRPVEVYTQLFLFFQISNNVTRVQQINVKKRVIIIQTTRPYRFKTFGQPPVSMLSCLDKGRHPLQVEGIHLQSRRLRSSSEIQGLQLLRRTRRSERHDLDLRRIRGKNVQEAKVHD